MSATPGWLAHEGEAREKLLSGAERILNGSADTAGGSHDLDYGHDLITEAVVEMAQPLVAEVKRSQAAAWDRLYEALGRTINGEWSIEAGWYVDQILRCTHLVGPTPAGHVPWRLASGGVYAAILDITVGSRPHITDEWLAENVTRMAECGQGTIVENRARYIDTVRRLTTGPLRTSLATGFHNYLDNPTEVDL